MAGDLQRSPEVSMSGADALRLFSSLLMDLQLQLWSNLPWINRAHGTSYKRQAWWGIHTFFSCLLGQAESVISHKQSTVSCVFTSKVGSIVCIRTSWHTHCVWGVRVCTDIDLQWIFHPQHSLETCWCVSGVHSCLLCVIVVSPSW